MSNTEVTTAEKTNSALPAHLQGGRKAKVGNLDTTDMIIPRVKLLQAISPEVAGAEAIPGAKAGEFWHTIMGQSLGSKITAVPILIKKSQVLWSPRNDDRGILARSSDGINWDAGFEDKEFEVKPKGSPTKIKYFTDKNVAASGLAEFGSSIPGDPNSPPALALTYNMMWFFPEFPDISPAVIINTRSSVKKAKLLISNLEMSPVDHYGRLFTIGTTDEMGDEGPYKGFSYTSSGFADEDIFNRCKSLFEMYSAAEWKPSDETEDEPSGGAGGKSTGTVQPEKGGKF